MLEWRRRAYAFRRTIDLAVFLVKHGLVEGRAGWAGMVAVPATAKQV